MARTEFFRSGGHSFGWVDYQGSKLTNIEVLNGHPAGWVCRLILRSLSHVLIGVRDFLPGQTNIPVDNLNVDLDQGYTVGEFYDPANPPPMPTS